MLGSALLVAPVFAENSQVTYYLPAGEWRHLLSGEVAQGPGWRTDTYDYFSLPLWVHGERGQAWDCLAL
jgi:alpha-D-xyloside xylohydrolase